MIYHLREGDNNSHLLRPCGFMQVWKLGFLTRFEAGQLAVRAKNSDYASNIGCLPKGVPDVGTVAIPLHAATETRATLQGSQRAYRVSAHCVIHARDRAMFAINSMATTCGTITLHCPTELLSIRAPRHSSAASLVIPRYLTVNQNLHSS